MAEDTNEMEQQIRQRIEELPPDIQDAVLSAGLNLKIQALGDSYKLHVDQTEEFGNLVMFTMLGFISEVEFRSELKDQLQLSPENVEKIVADTNTKIFLPIRESMKNFAAKAAGGDAAAPTTQAQAPETNKILMTAPPLLPTTTPASEPAAKPAAPAAINPADIMLKQNTVTAVPSVPTSENKNISPAPADPAAATAKTEPPKPQDYKADPYREPAI